jgi:hypothetical protein
VHVTARFENIVASASSKESSQRIETPRITVFVRWQQQRCMHHAFATQAQADAECYTWKTSRLDPVINVPAMLRVSIGAEILLCMAPC